MRKVHEFVAATMADPEFLRWLRNLTPPRDVNDFPGHYNERIMTAAHDFYPPGPSVPKDFTRPTAGYRRHAWVASVVLFLFVALYVFFAGWFLITAWRLASALTTADSVLEPLVGAVCAIFMSVFLLKGLIFVKRGSTRDHCEVTREEQPRLFAFLDRLAKEAGAPHPK